MDAPIIFNSINTSCLLGVEFVKVIFFPFLNVKFHLQRSEDFQNVELLLKQWASVRNSVVSQKGCWTAEWLGNLGKE